MTGQKRLRDKQFSNCQNVVQDITACHAKNIRWYAKMRYKPYDAYDSDGYTDDVVYQVGCRMPDSVHNTGKRGGQVKKGT